MPWLFIVCVCFCLLPVQASATIVGHLEADGVASLPQSVMDAIGEQRWLFTHASVGANMIGGMQELHSESATRYRLVFETAGDWSQIYPPPPITVPGTVYDGARGNPGWAAKIQMFDDAVRDLGWRYPTIEVAMDKLCYIDTDADASVYLATMTALENSYPSTVFVYATMPLQSGSNMDWANVLATNYNEAVRTHCSGNGRILLDLADVESHDPQGNHVTFVYGGQTYERMWSGYTSDGGHLNSLGARRVALCWYAAGAAIAAATGSVLDFPSAAPDGITSIVPNPCAGAPAIDLRLGHQAHASLEIFDASGRRIASLLDAEIGAGEHSLIWSGRNDAGAEAPAGIYFARLTAGRVASSRSFSLVR